MNGGLINIGIGYWCRKYIHPFGGLLQWMAWPSCLFKSLLLFVGNVSEIFQVQVELRFIWQTIIIIVCKLHSIKVLLLSLPCAMPPPPSSGWDKHRIFVADSQSQHRTSKQHCQGFLNIIYFAFLNYSDSMELHCLRRTLASLLAQ